MDRDGRLRERVGRRAEVWHTYQHFAADIVDVTRPVRSVQVRVGVSISSEYKVRVAKVMRKRA